jgi:chromosomal replication initiation ATPase DnaA
MNSLIFFERTKWPSLLGSENFISWIKETFFEKKKHRQVPESIQLAPDLRDIKREVCQAYGVAEKDLLKVQRGKSNEPRNVTIYLCRLLRNDTLIDLGQEFGMSGYSPAGSVIERVKKKLTKNRKLLKRVNQIKDTLLLAR